MVELLENVRGRDVFILQSTCAPTNDNLMEIMVMVDALKRASAARITARHSVLRLRAAGPPAALGPRADHGEGRRRHADDRRRRSRDGDGPARRPDPGLLQHPGRQHLRDADPAGRPLEAATTTTCWSCRRTSAASCAPARSPSASTRTWRSSTSGARKANVAEVMNIIGDVDGPHLRDHGRHRRHREHAVQGGDRAEGARREEGRRLLHAPGAVGRRGAAHRRLRHWTRSSSPTRSR